MISVRADQAGLAAARAVARQIAAPAGPSRATHSADPDLDQHVALTLRLPPGEDLLAQVLARIRALPAARPPSATSTS